MKIKSLADIAVFNITIAELSTPAGNDKVRQLFECGNDLDNTLTVRAAAIRRVIQLYGDRMGLTPEDADSVNSFPDIALVDMYGSQHGKDMKYIVWWCEHKGEAQVALGDLNYEHKDMASKCACGTITGAGYFRTMMGQGDDIIYAVYGEVPELGVKANEADLQLILSHMTIIAPGEEPRPILESKPAPNRTLH